MLVVEGRMDFESADYPGTGANNRHDPKTPGTVWSLRASIQDED